MAIYLTSFFLSCIFTKIAEDRKKNTWKIFFSFLAILITCLIAGLRAPSIGTDIQVYVLPLHRLAMQSASFSEYLSFDWYRVWKYVNVDDFEIGFNLLVYFSTKIFKSLAGVLFIIQLFIICPIYVTLFKLKSHQPAWLGMLVFYLLSYNLTLNLMRQSIAMSFLFLGFYYLLNNNDKLYFFLLIIAVFFHYTALIGIFIYILYKYIYHGADTKRIRAGDLTLNIKTFRIVLIAMIGIIILLSYNTLMPILNAIGLNKYINYIDGKLSFLTNQLILRLPILILFITNWKNLVKKDKNFYFYFLIVIFDLLFSQLSSINAQSGRIGSYFSMFLIFALPGVVTSYKRNSSKWFISSVIIIYLLVTWFYNFVLQGRTETVPYILSPFI